MLNKIVRLSVVAIMAIAVSAWANGRPSGTKITNTVSAKYTNSGGVKYTNRAAVTNTVNTIFGIHSVPQNANLTTSPGALAPVQFNVTNRGNNPIVLRLTNLYANTNTGFIASGAWSYAIYTNPTKSGGTVSFFNLAEDASRAFYLVATAPTGALDGAALTNKFASWLTNSFVASFTRLATYVGMNGLTNYGGEYSYTNRSIIIVLAPKLIVRKTASVTNSLAYLAIAQATARTNVVPGSMVIFSVIWTNAGSGSLYNLTITDPLQSSYTWVTNSIRFTNGTKLSANNVNYAKADNAAHKFIDGAAAPLVGNFGILANFAGGLNVSFASNIPGNARGTIFYKVYVK